MAEVGSQLAVSRRRCNGCRENYSGGLAGVVISAKFARAQVSFALRSSGRDKSRMTLDFRRAVSVPVPYGALLGEENIAKYLIKWSG